VPLPVVNSWFLRYMRFVPEANSDFYVGYFGPVSEADCDPCITLFEPMLVANPDPQSINLLHVSEANSGPIILHN